MSHQPCPRCGDVVRDPERVAAHQRRERGLSSGAWSALAIVAEVAGRYAVFAGAGLRIELILRPGGPTATVRFEDIKQRYWEVDLDDHANLSAFRGLVEIEILSFRNPGVAR